VRRLALARGGLLPSAWSGLPSKARGAGATARSAAHDVINRFGYLQLDTISVAGARSHALVLLSRLDGMDAALGEQLLVPGAPLFEYWGHAACWMPLALYPAFAFRRDRLKRHPWWGDLLASRRADANALVRRTREEGPFRSTDLEGQSGSGWWRVKDSKRLAEALWSSGELAIRERRGFQRVYDLPERVIPAEIRGQSLTIHEAFRALILLALDGHGWAGSSTIASTWNLKQTDPVFVEALRSLVEEGAIVTCAVRNGNAATPGWIRPRDLELAARLRRIRPRVDRGVLLTSFDPLLWDRARVRRLFGFDLLLEIYVPAHKRKYGYFCMPVLAGERLVARVDVKADRGVGRLRAVSCHFENPPGGGRVPASDKEAVRTALDRHAAAIGLAVDLSAIR
jgi:uncharacterized protein YcaQ